MADSVFPMDPSKLQTLMLDGSLIVALNETHSALQRVEARLKHVASEDDSGPEWLPVDEVAERLGRKPFTIREWCRRHRVNACKAGRRGGFGDWRIHRNEITRYRNEGLL